MEKTFMQCKCCDSVADLSISTLTNVAKEAGIPEPSSWAESASPMCMNCAELALDEWDQWNWLPNARSDQRLARWRLAWSKPAIVR
jgi:hypothetical protein